MAITRKQAFAGLTALGIGLAMAGGAAANDGDQVATLETEAALPVGYENVEVPYRDSRDITREAVQTAATRISSNGRQTIVLYAADQEIWDAAYEGAQISLAAGESKLNGFILAAGDQQEVAFYANGQLSATLLNPDPALLVDDIRGQLSRDYEAYIKGLGVALLQENEGPPVN